MSGSPLISYYFEHSTTPLVEKLRFALRQWYYSRWQTSPLWLLLRQMQATADPQTLCKVMEAPQRLYYDQHYSYAERVQALSDHHAFLLERLTAQVRLAVLNRQVFALWSYPGKTGAVYDLRLRVDHQMEKEGSLTLELSSENQPVVRCTWHFAKLQPSASDTETHWLARIGCLQSSATDTQEKIKQATKDFHGIQPRILILQALRSVCQALGVQGIEAICSARHVYSSRRYRKTIPTDYDQLWTFLGFARLPDGNFTTDTHIPLKALDDCPSHKRSEYRRRNECLQAMQAQLLQALAHATN